MSLFSDYLCVCFYLTENTGGQIVVSFLGYHLMWLALGTKWSTNTGVVWKQARSNDSTILQGYFASCEYQVIFFPACVLGFKVLLKIV